MKKKQLKRIRILENILISWGSFLSANVVTDIKHEIYMLNSNTSTQAV